MHVDIILKLFSYSFCLFLHNYKIPSIFQDMALQSLWFACDSYGGGSYFQMLITPISNFPNPRILELET